MKANMELRDLMRHNGVFQWEIAESIGCSENKLCRMLRRELPEAEKEKMVAAIEKVKLAKTS